MSEKPLASHRLATLGLLLCSSLIAVAGAEVAIRVLDLAAPLRQAAVVSQDTAQESIGDAGQDRSASNWILHPYRGITPRPLSITIETGRSGRNVLGILARELDPRTPLEGDPLVIGVFGGSVARSVGLTGMRPMEIAAQEIIGDDRPVRVINFAVSGYKQPQQLATLIEAQLLGVELSVVVNLDGYNEAVLAASNAQAGYHPLYPNYGSWLQALGSTTGSLTSRQIELSAEVLRLRRRAQAWRTRCSDSLCARLQLLRAIAGWRALSLDRRAVATEQHLRKLPVRKAAEDLFRLHDPCLENAIPDEECLDLALDYWSRASHQMKVLSEHSGAAYLHILQPNQYVQGSKVLTPEELEVAFDPSRDWSRIAIKAYPRLRERGRQLAAEGIAFHDLTQVFADEADSLYQDTCCHTNVKGSQIIGKAIGVLIGEEILRRRAAEQQRSR